MNLRFVFVFALCAMLCVRAEAASAHVDRHPYCWALWAVAFPCMCAGQGFNRATFLHRRLVPSDFCCCCYQLVFDTQTTELAGQSKPEQMLAARIMRFKLADTQCSLVEG